MLQKFKTATKGIALSLVSAGILSVLSDAATKYVSNLVVSHPKTAIIGIVATFVAGLFHQPAK